MYFFQCFAVCSVSPALCVRFMTKRFIGEYDNKKGETTVNIFLNDNYNCPHYPWIHYNSVCKNRCDLQMQSNGGPGNCGSGDFGYTL